MADRSSFVGILRVATASATLSTKWTRTLSFVRDLFAPTLQAAELLPTHMPTSSPRKADCGCWVSWSTTAAEGNSETMKNEVPVPLMVGGERFGTGSQISHNPLSWTMTD